MIQAMQHRDTMIALEEMLFSEAMRVVRFAKFALCVAFINEDKTRRTLIR